ncbi:glycosyltransferase family 4 protein [Demequina pelophila]|uniref:glycosyltransferase family 4 protein n=1 Tax=Demequina pelophila TaxID=1638984 RepID=UPI0007821CD7|nr:glycosyltransferase family 1 protein [Demequina pelophila]
MKVALVAESFLPHTNGVTHSLLRVLDHLTAQGHEAVIIAPEAKGAPDRVGAARVRHVPAVGWPGYRDVRVSLSGPYALGRMLDEERPDLVHLASPFMLGWSAVRAASARAIPTVAIYQTDVPAYAESYKMPWGSPLLWHRVRRIHEQADLTLAPSSHAMDQLRAAGVPRLRLWGRGVDTVRFDPAHRSEALRAAWAPRGETIVGYVGRLAQEKQVEDLAAISRRPGTRLVVVGDGPERARLERLMPEAVFTGFQGGDDLARAHASFDVFVHPGERDTFGQTIQEAHASGVPVVAVGVGGPVDLVRHGSTGYLYEPGRLDWMEAAVASLVDNPAERRLMGARGRAGVETRTWTHVCDALMEHYRDAAGSSSVGVAA